MTKLACVLALASGLLTGTQAFAGESEAEACVRQKVWDDYAEGWSIRTLTSTSLASGATQNYLVTLYKGNQYKVQTCSNADAVNVDILLYDLDGMVHARDEAVGPDPVVSFTPTATATYYLVAYARELKPGVEKVPVAVALTYR